MKILQLLGNTAFGGATLIVSDIAVALRAAGHEVQVMANDAQTQRHFKALGFHCHAIDHMGRAIHPIKDLKSIVALRKFIISEGFDAVHSHTTKGGIYARALSMLPDPPLIVHTVHGYYLKHDGSLSDMFTIAVERFFYARADHTTFVNRSDYELARGWSSRTRAHLIHNGVDTEKFTPNLKMKQQGNMETGAGPVVIGISARIVHEKGYREFLDLINHYLTADNVRFEILGTGPDEEIYKAQIKEILDRNSRTPEAKVVLHGHVEDVRLVLRDWNINVLPSYREGLSISLLEAMAMGIPSVATRIRGNVEIITDDVNGYLYESGDSAALIRAVNRLVENPDLRARIGCHAAERVALNFRKEKMLQLYLDIFNEQFIF